MNKIKISFLAISILLLSYGISSAQGLSFFGDEGEDLFNSTCPGLAIEDFEDTNIPSGDIFVCSNPMNSSTDGFCYSAGALIPGFSLSTSNPADNLLAASPPASGLTNVAVGANTSDMVITFTETVNAVGMVIVSFFGNSTVDVQVFGTGNALLGTATVNVATINGTFLGILSEVSPITRIELVETGQTQIDMLYELSFGPCDTTRPIPTLSEWSLIAMAGLLGIIGLLAFRRRKVTA